MAKVNIAIPTYNRSKYLQRAIESALSQTYQDTAIWIVDNASTDDTGQVVEKFGDSRIHYVRNETNLGISGNWNKCLDLALDSQYLLLFSDDDIMKDTLVERCVQVLDEHPEVVAVQSDFAGVTFNEELITDKISSISHDQLYAPLKFIEGNLTNQYAFGIFAMMLRTKTIKDNDLKFNERAVGWSHILLCLMLNIDHSLYFIAESLAYYRYHGTGSSGQDSRKSTVYDDVTQYYREVIAFLGQYRLDRFIDKARHGLMNYELLRYIYTSDRNLSFSLDMVSTELKEFVASPGFWRMDSASALKNQLFLILNGFDFTRATGVGEESVEDPTGVLAYYGKWVRALRNGVSISRVLLQRGVRRAVVFGTRIPAYFVMRDLARDNIEIEALLDNNGNMHGQSVNGVRVFGTQWLENHITDAVIVTIEGEHREGIKMRLNEQVVGTNTHVYTWQELLEETDNC